MLRAISAVAADCSSIAAAIPIAISDNSSIVLEIVSMAVTVLAVRLCTSWIWASISPVARAVWLASDLTSVATTVNPFPADPAAALETLQQVAAAKAKSAEIRLRIADHLIERTSAPVDEVMVHLDAATELRPFDWRPIWYCGKLYLSRGEPEMALACFDRVYDQLPGEAAPKLALAIALEGAGRHAEAANLYEISWRQDIALYAAPFGLGRSKLAQGDATGGIEAYGLIPQGSPARVEAQIRIAETCMETSDFQGAIAAADRIPADDAGHRRTKMAIVRKLTGGPDAPSSASNLSLASEVLAKIQADDLAFHEAKISLALEAVRLLDQGALQQDRNVRVLGAELRAKELRLQAEKSLRACARLVDNAATAAVYVDRANAARPRTLL
jgi:serine/threonine-protein kinase PknG